MENRYGLDSGYMRHPFERERSMVVPISPDKVFELPTFLLSELPSLRKLLQEEGSHALVARLCTEGRFSKYKSMDAIMRDSLQIGFTRKRLHCLVEGDHPRETYYVTHGAIFDYQFNPVMMMLWKVQPIREESGDFKYILRKPILRVSPHVLMEKKDAVQRYICNKIIPTTLAINHISVPSDYIDLCLKEWYGWYHVTVEIEKIDFNVKDVDVPSVSTTNEMLLDIALNHVEEAI